MSKTNACNTLLPCVLSCRLQRRCNGDVASTKEMRKHPMEQWGNKKKRLPIPWMLTWNRAIPLIWVVHVRPWTITVNKINFYLIQASEFWAYLCFSSLACPPNNIGIFMCVLSFKLQSPSKISCDSIVRTGRDLPTWPKYHRLVRNRAGILTPISSY